MRKIGIIVSAAALALGLGVAGCASGDMGTTGSYSTVTGNLTGTVDANLDRAYSAAKAAVSDMGFRVKKDQKDMTQAVIETRDAADHNIDITLKPLTDKTTNVTIGQNPVTGKESTARMLLDKIKSHVGM